MSGNEVPRFFFILTWQVRCRLPPKHSNTMNKRFILFACLLCSFPLIADRLTVQHRDASADCTEDIAAIGKWVFVNNRIQLLDHNGYLLGEEYMENIVKITFSETSPVPTSTDEALLAQPDTQPGTQPGTVIVYPNPTHEMLCVQGVPDDITLRVYSTTGQLLTTAQGTQINVGHLPCGTYLLQIGTQVLRFIKE